MVTGRLKAGAADSCCSLPHTWSEDPPSSLQSGAFFGLAQRPNCRLEGPARAGSKAGYRVRLVLLLLTISGKQLTEGVGRFEVLCTGPRRYHRWRSQGVLDGADIAPLLRELLLLHRLVRECLCSHVFTVRPSSEVVQRSHISGLLSNQVWSGRNLYRTTLPRLKALPKQAPRTARAVSPLSNRWIKPAEFKDSSAVCRCPKGTSSSRFVLSRLLNYCQGLFERQFARSGFSTPLWTPRDIQVHENAVAANFVPGSEEVNQLGFKRIRLLFR